MVLRAGSKQHGLAEFPDSITARGARLFPSPFVLPSGRSCRSFDELAIACQDDWKGAKELLQQGYLERFLGGVGRSAGLHAGLLLGAFDLELLQRRLVDPVAERGLA